MKPTETTSAISYNDRPRQRLLICDAKCQCLMFRLCYCALIGEDINAPFLKGSLRI